MTRTRNDFCRAKLPVTYRATIVLAMSSMVLGTVAPMAWSDSGHASEKAENAQLREDAETLLKANRSVLGKVQSVASDQIKVDIGEVQPRYLPLTQAKQKGFPEVKEGDDLIIVLNAENLLVDYHPLDGEASAHTIIRGEVAQNLTVGHDTVVIRSGDKEQSFVIRSQARSKLAAYRLGHQRSSYSMKPIKWPTPRLPGCRRSNNRTSSRCRNRPSRVLISRSVERLPPFLMGVKSPCSLPVAWKQNLRCEQLCRKKSPGFTRATPSSYWSTRIIKSSTLLFRHRPVRRRTIAWVDSLVRRHHSRMRCRIDGVYGGESCDGCPESRLNGSGRAHETPARAGCGHVPNPPT